jgi:hypothetical protein
MTLNLKLIAMIASGHHQILDLIFDHPIDHVIEIIKCAADVHWMFVPSRHIDNVYFFHAHFKPKYVAHFGSTNVTTVCAGVPDSPQAICAG